VTATASQCEGEDSVGEGDQGHTETLRGMGRFS
jgi:hypothetical protein